MHSYAVKGRERVARAYEAGVAAGADGGPDGLVGTEVHVARSMARELRGDRRWRAFYLGLARGYRAVA